MEGAQPPTMRWRAATRLGPLHGLPIAHKDLQPTRGHPHDVRIADSSATSCPTKIRCSSSGSSAAGAIVIGKTNTPEFGAGSQTFNPVFGATRNPYDIDENLRRQQRRRRGRARLRHAAARRRQRHGRIAAQPGELLQRRRPAAVAGPRAVWPVAERVVDAERRRPDGAHGRRRRAAARARLPAPIRDRRSRSRAGRPLRRRRSSATSAACASRGGRVSAACRSIPRSRRRQRAAAASSRRSAASWKRRSPISPTPTRSSRRCARWRS